MAYYEIPATGGIKTYSMSNKAEKELVAFSNHWIV